MIQSVWDRIPPSVRESGVELAGAETLVQTLSTCISQGMVTRWAAPHVADDAISCCLTCGQSMRRVASHRPRALSAFFGDDLLPGRIVYYAGGPWEEHPGRPAMEPWSGARVAETGSSGIAPCDASSVENSARVNRVALRIC